MYSSLTDHQLVEIDKCFVWTLENITADKIPFRKVLFGSTVSNWMKGEMSIVIADNPPNSNYRRVLPG